MYFIKDRQTNETAYYNTLNEIISHMEKYCENTLKKSRTRLMNEFIELGHGYDDKDSKIFTDIMREYLVTGIVTKNEFGTVLKECCLHEYIRNKKYKEETGD